MKTYGNRSVRVLGPVLGARGYQQSSARDGQQQSAREVVVRRFGGAGNGGRAKGPGRGWRYGDISGRPDRKSINIKNPARKYTQSYVFLQTFGEALMVVLERHICRRDRERIARLWRGRQCPKLGLCKGIATGTKSTTTQTGNNEMASSVIFVAQRQRTRPVYSFSDFVSPSVGFDRESPQRGRPRIGRL